MHFLLTAIGSYGDVHPMVGVGQALRRRGHRVQLITNPYFADEVTSAGLELVSLGTAEQYLQMLDQPNLWRPHRAFGLIFREEVAAKLRELYRLIDSNFMVGETVLVAHPLDGASRLFHEAHRAPLAAVTYSPVSFWSDHLAPDFGLPTAGRHMPWWVNRLHLWVGNRLVVGPAVLPALNQLRRDLGLGPSPHIFPDWWYRADLNLCLFPDWFAPPQPDWPQPLAAAGFPLWDGSQARPLDTALDTWLDQGEAPLVFAPGSANRQAASFFQVALEVCQRLDRRAILLTRYAEQIPTPLPSSVRHESFVPLARLLARASLLVHHGGIGTSSQALAAGIPQLVRPLAFDQFDNADRLVRLGVAREVRPRHFEVEQVARTINELLASPDVAQWCRQWQSQCDGYTALERACDALEQVAAGT